MEMSEDRNLRHVLDGNTANIIGPNVQRAVYRGPL